MPAQAEPTFPLWLIPALPFAGAAINLLLGRMMSRRFVHTIAVASVAIACVIAAWVVAGPLWHQFDEGTGKGVVNQLWTWIEVGSPKKYLHLKLELALRVDTLSAVMILVVTFVGTLIHIYSIGYMAHEPRYSTYFGYLNLFMGSMLVLVLGNNMAVMFIGWEGVGLCSYLLIGFWFSEEQNAYAGRKAFIVNRIGDFAFILGMCLLFWATGSLGFEPADTKTLTATYIGGERLAAAAGILLFIGACGKSAQIPLYVWLPDAMAGPTPVSALIHAATMVTAGVYMVARMSWLYTGSTTAQFVVATVGALTALVAAIIAFAQTDLKKVLAYSTVSQLGFMFVGVGTGAYVAGVFHLVTHAFFKAGLFLGAGSIMHAMSGSGDIRIMGGLRKKLPWTHGTFLIYCLAIAGIFPFAGFFSKDEILAGAFGAHLDGWGAWGRVLFVILSLAAFGTAFYMFRLYSLVFLSKCRADKEIQAHIHESPRTMTLPLVVLAIGACLLGFIGLPHIGSLPVLLSSWLEPSLVVLPTRTEFTELLFQALKAAQVSDVGAHHMEAVQILSLMGAATVVAVAGVLLGLAVYSRGIPKLGFIADSWLHRLVQNKFYVDEAYDLLIIRPLWWIGRTVFNAIDRLLIDSVAAHGSARIIGFFSQLNIWVQNGQLQRYLVALLVGGAIIFYCASQPVADFAWKRGVSGDVTFQADVGEGPGAGTGVEWDFDGDGKTDSTEPTVTWRFTKPGKQKVTLRVKNAVFDKAVEITKTVDLGSQGGRK